MATASRGPSLLRAIHSVQKQTGVRAVPLVVVNGDQWNPALVNHLSRTRDLKMVRVDEAGLGSATACGRSLVGTPTYGFLDDDDELLPGALAARRDIMVRDEADLVVSNGFQPDGRLTWDESNPPQVDPLRALAARNWLASCAGLYRTTSISLDFFDRNIDFQEWPLVAFRVITADKRVSFVDVPGYKLTRGNSSLSTRPTKEQTATTIEVARRMAQEAPRPVRREFRQNLARHLQTAVEFCMERRQMQEAWRYQIEAIRFGGLAYLSNTAKLFAIRGRSTSTSRGRIVPLGNSQSNTVHS